ncbi:acyl-CoA dehydrogenase family protein [Micromonospora sp. NPDC047793]|uniref:acyl-CoA dehydrogenase family protein n=1 Tax=unclassified Micromonospora TaxID=2617518 RepID=UPI0013761E05|nr:acyl-CoA dehydrogenase family protein [Verrucosispora sp. SN26_14.1]
MTPPRAPADVGSMVPDTTLPPAPARWYADALDELHHRLSPTGPVPSPTGHVVASPAALPAAAPGALARFGVVVSRAASGAATPSAHPTVPDPVGDGRSTTIVPVPQAVAEAFATGLLHLHRRLLHEVLRHTLRHLGARTSAGTTLLARQLVQAQLAEVAIRLAEVDATPQARRDQNVAARWRTHRRLVGVGRDLLRLLGASGFLVDGPAGDLHLAEVAGNVYLHPGRRQGDG